MIFYEAPTSCAEHWTTCAPPLARSAPLPCAGELTKLHEEITKTTIGEAVRYYEQNDPRGEYVLVMAGTPAAQAAAEEVTLPDAVATARLLMAQGTRPPQPQNRLPRNAVQQGRYLQRTDRGQR